MAWIALNSVSTKNAIASSNLKNFRRVESSGVRVIEGVLWKDIFLDFKRFPIEKPDFHFFVLNKMISYRLFNDNSLRILSSGYHVAVVCTQNW